MSDEEKKTVLDSLPTKEIPTDDFIELYVNSSKISAGVYDFVLDFGVSNPDGAIKQKIRIRMAPQHAWVFMQILSRTMKAYIEKVGSFEFPIDFLKEKDLLEEYNIEIKRNDDVIN